MKERFCRWKCGRKTDRRCRICLQCCTERDELHARIHAGLAKYIPPQDRPGHRFYERKVAPRSEAQKAAAMRLGNASRLKSKGKGTPKAELLSES